MEWLDKIAFTPLLMVTVLLGLAPFSTEPHLLEKLRLIGKWQLSRPIDIFDLMLHATPLLLLVMKLARRSMVMGASKTS